MLNIRKNMFETNSSSSDYYRDDRYDDWPRYCTATQRIVIELEWAEDISEARQDAILGDIDNVADDFENIFADFYPDCEDYYIDEVGDEIAIQWKFNIGIHWISYGSPATRYDPGEGPEAECDDYDCVPHKSQPFPEKEKVKEKLMQAFKKQGWNEIVGIANVWGDWVDEDEALDDMYRNW